MAKLEFVVNITDVFQLIFQEQIIYACNRKVIVMKISSDSEASAFTIYVGLNNKNTYQQMVDSDVLAKMIKNVCGGYRVSYSTHMQQGGYVQENGEYVQELSAAIILIGATRENVNSIAADLCCFLNQETVLVETRRSIYYTVSESIDLNN